MFCAYGNVVIELTVSFYRLCRVFYLFFPFSFQAIHLQTGWITAKWYGTWTTYRSESSKGCRLGGPQYHHGPSVPPWALSTTMGPQYHHGPSVPPWALSTTMGPQYHHGPSVPPWALSTWNGDLKLGPQIETSVPPWVFLVKNEEGNEGNSAHVILAIITYDNMLFFTIFYFFFCFFLTINSAQIRQKNFFQTTFE